MKACPYCGKEYPDEVITCQIDGEQLVDSGAAKKHQGTWAGFWRGAPRLPELPVEEEEKSWLENSLLWLLDEFGADHFLNHKTILPERHFFPDKFTGSEESVAKLVAKICSYMDVDPALIDLEFMANPNDIAANHRTGNMDPSSQPAGLYVPGSHQEQRQKIIINLSAFQNSTALVATIAHELGHVILLTGERVSPECEHHEPLTDLLTVFLGLGIFTANSAFQFSQWQDNSHQGWSSARLGYLSEEAFAFSLAAYAWMRGEINPAWSKYLDPNVKHYFLQCLDYFNKGGTTVLKQVVPAKS